MAITVAGRELTLTHRLEQARIAARAELQARAAMRYLDLSDLDASTPSWTAMQIGLLRGRYAESRALAERYISDFRFAELGSASGIVVAPTFPEAAAQTMLRVTGPVAIKTMIGRGMHPEVAFDSARRGVSGRAQKWALGGGRRTVTETARADRRVKRYRRVTGSSKTCAFCGMLVARSIVGRSFADVAFAAHAHCRCTAELVYGEMPTTEAEDAFISSYDDAARAADDAGEKRTAKNILPRMRASGIFRDSPTP